MKIQFNGKALEIPAATTLKQLIELQGLSNKRLAAEVNQQIITKTDHDLHVLNEHDSVEIVHAIGGG